MGTENETEPTNAPPVIDANTVEVPPSKKKRAEATDNANWVRENNSERGIPQENAHLKGRRDDRNDAAKRALEEQKENMKIRGITKQEAQNGVPADVGKNDFKVPKGEVAVDEAELAAVRDRFNKLTAEAPKKASPTKRASPEKRVDLGLDTDSTEEEKEARRANEREEKRIRDNFKAGKSSIPDSYSSDSTGETESAKLRRLAAEKAKKEAEEADKRKKVPTTSKPNDIKTPDGKSPIKPLKTADELAKEADLASPGKRIDASDALTPTELAEIAAETEGVEQIKTRIGSITSPTSRERGDLISTVDDLKKKREGLQKKYATKSREKAFQSLISRINEVESLADEKLKGKASSPKEEAERKLVRDAKSPIDTVDSKYGKYVGIYATPEGKPLTEYVGKDGNSYYLNYNGELVDKDGKKLPETPSAKKRREEAQEAHDDDDQTVTTDTDIAKSQERALADLKDKLIKKVDSVDISNPFTGKSHHKYGALLGTNKVNGTDINMYSDGTKDGVYYTNGANDRVDINGVPIIETVEDKEKRIKAQTLVQKEDENKKSNTQDVKGVVSDITGWLGKRGENINKHIESENRDIQNKRNATHRSLLTGAAGSSSSGSSGGVKLNKEGQERLALLKLRLEYYQTHRTPHPQHGSSDDNEETLKHKIDKLKSGKDDSRYYDSVGSSGSGYTVDSHGRVVKKDSLYGSSSSSGSSKGGPTLANKDLSALTTKYTAKDAGGTIMGHAKGKDIGGTIMGHASGKDAAGTIMGGGGGKDAAGTIMGRAGHDARGTIMGRAGHDARGTIMGTSGHNATGTIMGTGANAGGSIIDGNGTVIQGVNSRKNAEGSILGNNGKSPEGTIMGANAKNAEGSIIGGITKKNATGSIMGVVKNNLVTTTEEPVLDEYGEPIVEYNEDGTPKAPVFSEKKTMVVAAKQGNVLGITPNGKAGHTSRIVRPGIQQHNGNAIGVDNTGHAGHPSGIMRGTIKAKEDGSVAIAGARPSKMAHVAAEIGNKGNTVGIHGGHPSGIMRGYAKKEASGIGESHPSGIMRGAVKADVNGIGESHPSGIMRGTVKKDGNAVGESHPSKIMRGTVDATKSTTMMDYAAKVGSHPSGMMRGIQADKMNLPQGDKIGLAQGSKLGFAQSDKIDLSKSEKGGHPSNILRTGAPTKKAGNPIPSGEKGGHPSNILRAQIKEKNGHPSHLLVKAARLDKSGHPSQMMRQGFSQPVTLTASLAEPSSFDNRAAPIALIANNAPMLSQPKLQRDIMIPAVKTSPIIPPKSNGGMLGGLLAQRGFNIPEARHTPIPSPPPSLMSPSVSYNTVVTPSPNTDPRTGMIPDVIKGDKVKLGLSFGGAPEVKKESLIGSKIL